MGKTVTALKEEMSSREFTDWKAFTAIEPIGERRQDIRNAYAIMFFGAPFRKKGQKVSLSSLVPDWWKEPASSAPAVLKMKLFSFASHFNQTMGKRTG